MAFGKIEMELPGECVSSKRVYVLIAAICLGSACSRDPLPTPRAELRAVKAAPQVPVYSAASIAPSGAMGPAPLGPGRVASIYGQNLGPAEPCLGSPDPNRRETPSSLRPNQTPIEMQVFPVKLCDTEVQVGGVAAGLLYVSSVQINFKVPQTVQTQGETSIRVLYKGQAGPSVSIPLAADSPAASAEQIAERMWAALGRVGWQRQYEAPSGQCAAVPSRQGFRADLQAYAYYCPQTNAGVIAESFYYPVDHADPKLLLLRADIRPEYTYPELSAEVEQFVMRRLTQAYGPGGAPDNLYEIGASRPEPGLSWRAGNLTIFLHRKRSHAAPAGIRQGVILIAVREEALEQRRIAHRIEEAFRSAGALSQPVFERELEEQLPGAFFPAGSQYPNSEPDRVKAERQTRTALLRLLRQSTGEPEQRAAALVAADALTRRLGSLLVARSVKNGSEHLTEAEGAGNVRIELSSHGVRFNGIGHYSGVLEYDYSLLARAWKEYPETKWGQRAFLMLQRLGCSTPRFGCDGPNCFLSVIQQGESFLDRYPGTPFRTEQTYHLAQANETWWSLAHAAPGDLSAQGARVTKASAERARQRAIDLYEEILRIAPGAPEAEVAQLALPRLKLKLDTGERTFFCFSC